MRTLVTDLGSGGKPGAHLDRIRNCITRSYVVAVVLLAAISGCSDDRRTARISTRDVVSQSRFDGKVAGDSRVVADVELRWCPAGDFMMGSPVDEPERRPGEDQVKVTLTNGFWMGRCEVTQGEWKRIMGDLPGELTDELPAGDDLPVGNVTFVEAEMFCSRLTELGHSSTDLPSDWEIRLPTEAQWEYACRAGTMTATSFGNSLSRNQANFGGQAI